MLFHPAFRERADGDDVRLRFGSFRAVLCLLRLQLQALQRDFRLHALICFGKSWRSVKRFTHPFISAVGIRHLEANAIGICATLFNGHSKHTSNMQK